MVHAIRPTRTSARCGFTLIELLIVVTIILVLVSLSVAGVMKVLNLQQRRNTEQTVSKLDKGLAQQWKAVIDTAKTEQVNPIAQGLAGNDALGNNRARVIHILMCLRREFPTNFTEATQTLNWPGVGSFAPNPAYVRALSGASAASLGRPPEDQSSACLYLALKQRRRGIDFDPDTGLSSGELYDRFNDGLKEISDGWQRTSNPSIPIIFNRWPASGYGAGVGNPPTPAIGTLQPFNAANPPDKEDPEGLLANLGWQQWLVQQNLVATFQTNVGYPLASPPQGASGPYQYTLTPVIISLGSNGKYDQGIQGADDIINFQLR